MFLTKSSIQNEMKKGRLSIDPYHPEQCNPNSYNVRLGSTLLIYDVDNTSRWNTFLATHFPKVHRLLGLRPGIFDLKKENTFTTLEIPDEGMVLYPGTLYLGHTQEVTSTPHHVPVYEGRSSLARAGVESHVCAGWGDVGFEGTWTLEIRVTYPTRIYPGFEIGQVGFSTVCGETNEGYGSSSYKSRYQGQRKPVPYLGHLDFIKKDKGASLDG